MRTKALLSLGVVMSIAASCGGSTVVDPSAGGTTSTGSGGSGGTTSTGTTSTGIGGSTTTTSTGGHGGSATCGGLAGTQCDAGFYCDFQPSYCGGDDSTGICLPRPSDCPDMWMPVCACDGNVYSNPCDANSAGWDVNWFGGCPAPQGMFPCGVGFCQLDQQYCRLVISDVAGWDHEFSCEMYPPGCGNNPSCGCLQGEPCGDLCEDDGSGNYTLTCPGG